MLLFGSLDFRDEILGPLLLNCLRKSIILVITAYYGVLFLNFAIPAFVAAMGVLNEEIFEEVFQIIIWI